MPKKLRSPPKKKVNNKAYQPKGSRKEAGHADCPHCGRSFNKRGIHSHQAACLTKLKQWETEDIPVSETGYWCNPLKTRHSQILQLNTMLGFKNFKEESSYPPSEHCDDDSNSKSLIRHSFCLQYFSYTIYLADLQDVNIPQASGSRLHTAIGFPARENEDLTDHESGSSDSLMDVSTGESGYSPVHIAQEMDVDNGGEIQNTDEDRKSDVHCICLKTN